MTNDIRKKVLVTDSIAPAGVDVLRRSADVDVKVGLSPDQLESMIGDYHALVVRSQTRVTGRVIDAARKLEVIGRAGVGVDNIDVEAATRHGVFVINSPEGNIVSAAEHTIAMLLAMIRQIPRADRELRAGVWNRSIRGVEVRNKVLGIIGLGRVGTAVAEMARGLRMNVVAYDPMVSRGAADRIGIQIMDMEPLLASSDFITVHVPLNASTRGMIGKEQLAMMKPTAMIVNCARGGIIDEQALYEALEEKRIAAAAVDVFTKEPALGNILLQSDKVVVTPHLAASTSEAETSAGTDVAEQIVAVLSGHPPKSPVNAPMVPPEVMETIGQYMEAGTMLGVVASQLLEGQATSISIRYQGDFSRQNTDPIKATVLSGMLERLTDERVNMVNMDLVAARRGLRITEERDTGCDNYSSMITVEIDTNSRKTTVAATSLRGRVYLVRVDDFWFEIEPSADYMLFTEHKDRPGVIGEVGTIIGNAGINISQMQVSRDVRLGGKAMMVLCLDDPIPPDAQQRILDTPDMYKVRVISLAK